MRGNDEFPGERKSGGEAVWWRGRRRVGKELAEPSCAGRVGRGSWIAALMVCAVIGAMGVGRILWQVTNLPHCSSRPGSKLSVAARFVMRGWRFRKLEGGGLLLLLNTSRPEAISRL